MNSPFDQAQQLTSLWMDFGSRMMNSARAFTPDESPPEIAKEVRSTMFSAMSEQTEKFMRSPQFLQMMKQSLDQSISMRKQLNDLLTKVHHSVQGVAQQDVDTLLLSVRHLEGRLLEQMQAVVEKLGDIDRRIDAIEQASRGDNTNGQAQPRREQGAGTGAIEKRE